MSGQHLGLPAVGWLAYYSKTDEVKEAFPKMSHGQRWFVWLSSSVLCI